MPRVSYMQTAVITPPASQKMTLSDTVMQDWGIDGDNRAFIERAIIRCSRAAADYCNRDFGIAKYSVTARLERGYRDGHLSLGRVDPIMIPYWPITSTVSVTETDINGVVTTLVEGTDFEVDISTGSYYRLDANQIPRDWYSTTTVMIVLWSGYVFPDQAAGQNGIPAAAPLIPAHLEDAIGRMVATRYFESRRDPYVKSETVEGIGSTNYITQGSRPTDAGNLSPDVSDILDNFRAPIVA